MQSDQGSNFISKTFKQALQTLGVSHAVSSAYHHESQGALERWHQTLKSMLKKYCFDTGHGWDEGVPFVPFAIRDAKKESLGFSPAELVFGHRMRGPLKMLKEKLLSGSSPKSSVPDFVSQCKERLRCATSLAKEALSSAQDAMKRRFDKKFWQLLTFRVPFSWRLTQALFQFLQAQYHSLKLECERGPGFISRTSPHVTYKCI